MLEGPLIIVANHLNWSDPLFLCIIFPRHITFMAKEELFRSPFLSFFLSHGFGAFPVRRGRFDRKALHQADAALGKGAVLGMFPEGSRSNNAQLQRGLPGAALIALHSGAQILPVGITGSKQISGVAWLFHRPQIVINVGQPFKLPQSDKMASRDRLASLTDFIMERIAELLPQEHRGSYQGRSTTESEDEEIEN
jgi:1-acyl-sn-glycerol-3-phosphate acyltransferase